MIDIQPGDKVYETIKDTAEYLRSGHFECDYEESDVPTEHISVEDYALPLTAAALVVISKQLNEMSAQQTEILMQLKQLSERQVDEVIGAIYDCH